MAGFVVLLSLTSNSFKSLLILIVMTGLPDFYIYLIFSVTIVMAARMMVVIQNLTVIFDSLN